MTATTESNREQAIKLQAQGKSVKEISEILGVSRVSCYKYLQGNQPGATSARAVSVSDSSMELELLRIENQSLYAQLALYKRECARLQSIVDSE